MPTALKTVYYNRNPSYNPNFDPRNHKPRELIRDTSYDIRDDTTCVRTNTPYIEPSDAPYSATTQLPRKAPIMDSR